MDEQPTAEQFTEQLIDTREKLRTAVWSPSWDVSRDILTEVWRDLVALGLGMVMSDDSTSNAIRALGSVGVRALRLVQRALETAEKAVRDGENPTAVVRESVNRALVVLDGLGER